jgi:hypothetical protein
MTSIVGSMHRGLVPAFEAARDSVGSLDADAAAMADDLLRGIRRLHPFTVP